MEHFYPGMGPCVCNKCLDKRNIPHILKSKKKKLSQLPTEQLNKAIGIALIAPFPQIAIHHLIDKLFELYEPDELE